MAEKKAPAKGAGSKATTKAKEPKAATKKAATKAKVPKAATKAKEPKTAAKAKEPEAALEAPAEERTEAKRAPRVKIKPQLDEATQAALAERRAKKQRTPVFRRQEWFRYKKLARTGWRRPRGIQSKMRKHLGYRPNVVSIGYAGPAAVRGLHPSGFREILVHNAGDLEGLDPKTQAARIAGAVGAKKREVIEREAERLKIRVLNPMHERGGEE